MPDLQEQPKSASAEAPRPSGAAQDPIEVFSHLAKMSGTGSSFGQADYVAINAAAVITLLLGVASGLSIIFSLFLFIPVLGLILGLISIRQISTSNGTQSGTWLAVGGMALSLLIGGYVVTSKLAAAARARANLAQCDLMVHHFGEQLKAASEAGGDSSKADQILGRLYDDSMTKVFRSRFSLEAFRSVLRNLINEKDPKTGKPAGIELAKWNGDPVEFAQTDDGAREEVEMGILMQRPGQPNLNQQLREWIRMTNSDDQWKIDGMRQLFPLKTDAQDQQQQRQP